MFKHSEELEKRVKAANETHNYDYVILSGQLQAIAAIALSEASDERAKEILSLLR